MTQIVVAQRMWQRRDTAANWSAANPVLAAGEIGVELGATPEETQFKIGDGSTPWNALPYFSGEFDLLQAYLSADEASGVAGGDGVLVLQDGDLRLARADDFGGGGGGGVQEVVAGANVAVDSTDPARPVVSASGQPGPEGPPGPVGPRGGGIVSKEVRSLLHFEGGLEDAADRFSWTAVAPAEIDTGVSRFGGSSLYFPAVDGRVRTIAGTFPDMASAGDFTAEAWVRRSSATRNAVFSHRSTSGTSTDGWYFSIMADGSLQLVFGIGGHRVFSSAMSGLVPLGQWAHLAVVKAGLVVRVFVEGIERIQGILPNNAVDHQSALFVLGAEAPGGAPADRSFLGHMDEFRYSSVARYTSNFTPPSEPFALPVAPQLPDYTVATLPNPTGNEYVMVYVTDLAGGAEPCISDGTAWRRLSDRSEAS